MTGTVLVVEDEVVLLQAIVKKLELAGVAVATAITGREAVSYLQKAAEMPAVIWLDYYLPDMDGQAFVRAMSRNPVWAKIPVVVVSNSASPEKVREMKEAGAKFYLLKAEHRLEEIVEIMKSYLKP